MNNRIFKILLIPFFFSCSDLSNNSDPQSIQPINVVPINISEPSGLSFGYDYQSYWIVNDGVNGNVYQVRLDGSIARDLGYNSDDLEGICYDHGENRLWIVEEKTREVIKMDLNGNVLVKHPIPVDNTNEHGFEGITVLNANEIWLSHEKSPRLLIKINNQFLVQNELDLTNAKDFSGLSYNPADSVIWIVSDQSELLIKWELKTNKVTKYGLPFPKAEGVAVNPQNNTIHIVSDETSLIYIFNIPD